jgi:uncharacterized protein YegJ (DUF2314 family)
MIVNSCCVLCLLVCFLCTNTGCESSGLPNFPHRVVSVDERNEEMNLAILRAKETFRSFERNWRLPEIESCSLKFAMDTDIDRIEHVWFTPVRIEGDQITARCANDPKNVRCLKIGDVRTLDRASLSDWMIMAGGKCYGGYTIRALAKIDPSSVPKLQFADYPEDGKDTKLADRYGGFFRDKPKLQLSPAKVPPSLRPYIDWAAYWGVSDDYDREDLRKHAPREALEELQKLVDQIDDDLNEWLAGPAAAEDPPTEEYVAFSAMRMVAY